MHINKDKPGVHKGVLGNLPFHSSWQARRRPGLAAVLCAIAHPPSSDGRGAGGGATCSKEATSGAELNGAAVTKHRLTGVARPVTDNSLGRRQHRRRRPPHTAAAGRHSEARRRPPWSARIAGQRATHESLIMKKRGYISSTIQG